MLEFERRSNRGFLTTSPELVERFEAFKTAMASYGTDQSDTARTTVTELLNSDLLERLGKFTADVEFAPDREDLKQTEDYLLIEAVTEDFSDHIARVARFRMLKTFGFESKDLKGLDSTTLSRIYMQLVPLVRGPWDAGSVAETFKRRRPRFHWKTPMDILREGDVETVRKVFVSEDEFVAS
jgi:hypothetical protein